MQFKVTATTLPSSILLKGVFRGEVDEDEDKSLSQSGGLAYPVAAGARMMQAQV